ncbi:OmpA family protein, partial [bacterium]|nr:OmpA family protein [bacterium]
QKLSRIILVKDPFLKNVLVGASLRLVTESLEEVNVFGGALDIGAIWRQTEEFKDSADKPAIRDKGWRLGLTAQNLGVSTDKLMPMNFRLGTGYVVQDLFTPLGRGTAGLDILIPIDNEVKITLGAEYAHISEHTESAIRMGYKVGPEIRDLDSLAGLTAGAGFAIQSGVLKYRLDYAFVPYGELGSAHRVSLTLTFLPSSPGLPGSKISQPTDLISLPSGSLSPSLLPQEQEENLATKRDKELSEERASDEAKLKAMLGDIRNKIELVRRKLGRLNILIKQGKLPAVRFQAGKAVLQRESFKTLDKIGEILEKHSQVKVRIEGHTDSDGETKGNQRLSQKRVEAVKKYLVSIFELRAANLIPVGYGETHPIASNKTPEGRKANRRVEMRVLIPAGTKPKAAVTRKPEPVNAKKSTKAQISQEEIISYEEIDKLREKLKVYEMQMDPAEVEEMFKQQHRSR